MMRIPLMPGSLVCDAAGLREAREHGEILRMFINALAWDAIGVIAIVVLFL